MKIIKQLCIKSYEITSQNGDYFKAEQGKEYTTSVPVDNKDYITVFSRHWVPIPKENFVPMED